MGVKTSRIVVGLLVLAVAGALSGVTSAAQRRLTRARQVGLEPLQQHRQDLRISGAAHGLVERRARTDEQGTSHIRYQQTYNGLEVFEGEVIAHVDDRDEVELTSALRGDLRLDTRQAVDSAAAAATAAHEAGLAGRFEATPVLKVLPRGERSDYDRLVWQVRVTGATPFDPVVQWDVFVDAKTCEVAWAFDSLQTAAATGIGKTMYSSNVSVSTDYTSSTYYLRDLTRGGGNYTCDVNNRTDFLIFRASCTTFTRSNNIFGNNVKDSSDRIVVFVATIPAIWRGPAKSRISSSASNAKSGATLTRTGLDDPPVPFRRSVHLLESSQDFVQRRFVLKFPKIRRVW